MGFVDPRSATEQGRRAMTRESFYTGLYNLTYCYPDIKLGRIFGLDPALRTMLNRTGRFSYEEMLQSKNKYQYGGSTTYSSLMDDRWIRKHIKLGDGKRSIELLVECVYVDVQEMEGKYAFSDIKYDSDTYTTSSCYCIREYLCSNFEANSQAECNEEDVGLSTGPNHYFFPKGFVAETVTARIKVYPLLFSSSDFYMGGEKNTSSPKAANMVEALNYILLHELGHIEETLVNKVGYGGRGDFGKTEEDMDAFASSVRRCVE